MLNFSQIHLTNKTDQGDYACLELQAVTPCDVHPHDYISSHRNFQRWTSLTAIIETAPCEREEDENRQCPRLKSGDKVWVARYDEFVTDASKAIVTIENRQSAELSPHESAVVTLNFLTPFFAARGDVIQVFRHDLDHENETPDTYKFEQDHYVGRISYAVERIPASFNLFLPHGNFNPFFQFNHAGRDYDSYASASGSAEGAIQGSGSGANSGETLNLYGVHHRRHD